MITNADITIYNGYITDDGLNAYQETQIKGVSFYTKQETTTDETGLSSADNYQIRIPVTADTNGRTYVEADKFQTASDKERKQHWTIDNGDLFVKGLYEAIRKATQITDLPNSGQIVSFSDNRRGAFSMHHFRIGGK
ncbi:MAG: hypothetical protein PHT21_11585 [Lachnospiraceae bacterium]|nr:hypothetical protein [Lachnospiraceae bacterium]